ncbi:MAG: ABC transporter ATP-binding protein [Chloroflexi bacterium]|nr:ABC transporter ATP-binding protein [Chloroflexota bacterium]
MVECRSVGRRFPTPDGVDVVAVDGVDLTIGRGEFVAVEGPSGSGKTTLLGLLAGLDLAESGTVEVLGHDLSRLSPAERARLRQTRVGIVFQTFGLIASLDALDNVALPLSLAGVPADERAERGRAALTSVGLGDRGRARVDELSGGERQRVGIARALVIAPSLILADEPTGNLDERQGHEIVDLLAERVARAGASLILVTHDPVSAARADRRYHMLDGRLAEVAS